MFNVCLGVFLGENPTVLKFLKIVFFVCFLKRFYDLEWFSKVLAVLGVI